MMRVTVGSIVLKSSSLSCMSFNPMLSQLIRGCICACYECYKQEYERAKESEQEDVEAFDIILSDAPIEHATVMINVHYADITVGAMLDLQLGLQTMSLDLIFIGASITNLILSTATE